MTEIQIYVRKYMMLADTDKWVICCMMGFFNYHANQYIADKKFFEYIKENDKFDMLVVILDNPGIRDISEVISQVRQRKLDRIIK